MIYPGDRVRVMSSFKAILGECTLGVFSLDPFLLEDGDEGTAHQVIGVGHKDNDCISSVTVQFDKQAPDSFLVLCADESRLLKVIST